MIKKLRYNAYTLLRWSEQYTKTDMVYLTSGGFWLLIKMVLTGLISLGVSVAFANLLSQHTYGQYKYVFSIFGLLAIPTLMGMSTSVTKSVALGFEGTPLAALRTKVLWGTIGSAASAAIGIYYALQGNLLLGEVFWVVALFLPFVDTLGLFNTVLNGQKYFRVSVYYEVGVQSVAALAIVTALFFTGNLLIIIGTYFASYTLARAVAFYLVMKHYTTNRAVDGHAIGYGKHLSVMDILSTAAEAIDSMLLWQFLGAAPLAVFAFAKAIPVQMLGALKKIPLLALPKFAQRDLPSIKRAIVPKLLQLWIVLFGIVFAYIFAAPYIFTFLFPQYTEAIIYSQLFALTLLTFPKKMIGTIFNAHGRTKALYINSILTPIVKIVVTVLLIPLLGIMGAIISELVSQTFSLALVSYLLFKTKS